MNKNNMIKRIKSNKAGRILCRIIGEDTGAVMMEYVLVAMLVAAATVAAVSYFGRDTQGMFGVIGRAIWGASDKAIEMREKGVQDSEDANKKAQEEGGKFSTLQGGETTRGM